MHRSSDLDVSVVIPAFESARYIGDAISSVLRQTVPVRECVVVDDGSTDETGSVADSFGDQVRVIHTANRGVSAARNTGAEAAQGQILAFLDADDVWLPRKSLWQLRLLQQDPEIELVYGALHIVDEDLRFVGRLEAAPGEIALRNTLLLEKPFMTGIGSTAIVRRSTFHEIGGFDEQLSTSADFDLACRLALRSRVEGVQRPVALYRLHSGQMHSEPLRTERETRIVFQKFFHRGVLPGELERFKGRALANLDISIAGRYFVLGRASNGIRFALRALVRRPARVAAAMSRLVRGDAPTFHR